MGYHVGGWFYIYCTAMEQLRVQVSQPFREGDNSNNFEELALDYIDETASVDHSALHQPTPATHLQGKVKTKREQLPKRLERGVEDNPEYYRIDDQLSSKLYEIYHRLTLGPQQPSSFTFEQRVQSNATLNYHKIMEMLKEVQVPLQISHKLTILRAIKKFSFNHNFISRQEWSKVFKVIVHGLSIKESRFWPVVREKYASVVGQGEAQKTGRMGRAVSIKLNKNFGAKGRTDANMGEVRRSKVRVVTEQGKTGKQAKQARQEKSGTRTIQPIKPLDHSLYRSRAPKQLQHSIVTISRRTAADYAKRRVQTDASRYQAPSRSYLSRALQKNKLSVVSWDSLFKMTEHTLTCNVSIPSFIDKEATISDLYL